MHSRVVILYTNSPKQTDSWRRPNENQTEIKLKSGARFQVSSCYWWSSIIERCGWLHTKGPPVDCFHPYSLSVPHALDSSTISIIHCQAKITHSWSQNMILPSRYRDIYSTSASEKNDCNYKPIIQPWIWTPAITKAVIHTDALYQQSNPAGATLETANTQTLVVHSASCSSFSVLTSEVLRTLGLKSLNLESGVNCYDMIWYHMIYRYEFQIEKLALIWSLPA